MWNSTKKRKSLFWHLLELSGVHCPKAVMKNEKQTNQECQALKTQQAKQQLHPLSDDTNFTQITLTAIIHLSFFLQMKKSTKNPELVSVSKRHDRCTGEHEHHAKSLHSNLIWWLKIKIKKSFKCPQIGLGRDVTSSRHSS